MLLQPLPQRRARSGRDGVGPNAHDSQLAIVRRIPVLARFEKEVDAAVRQRGLGDLREEARPSDTSRQLAQQLVEAIQIGPDVRSVDEEASLGNARESPPE